MAEKKFDVVVIGAGPGGYVAAIRAAQLGLKTACIEKRDTLGGTCLNVGCIPSKALLESSHHYDLLCQHGQEHGITASQVKLDFEQMQKRKSDVVSGLTQGVAGLLKKNQIASIQGEACLKSPHEVVVKKGKKEEVIEAKQIILATGSDPIELPFLPFDEKQILSSTGALELSKVPKKMLVIGAGVIGLELASVYQRLGSEVEVFELMKSALPGMDRAVSKAMLMSLKKQGLKFHLGVKVVEGKANKKGVTIKVEEKGDTVSYSGDVVLVGVGRRPYTAGLGLDAVGIHTDPRGFVQVDGAFRTNIPNIYAIGDIVDGAMLAHRASEEGIAVAELIAGEKPHINYTAIPNIVYTNPEVAAVGLTEEQAKDAGLETFIGTYSFRGNPRARCSGETDGTVKVIGEKLSGRLIGLHIVSANASEMIGEGVIAIEKRATVEEVARSSHGHPTRSEAIMEACLNALGRAIHM